MAFQRFSISKKNRLIDSEPLQRGDSPLVWSPDRQEWLEMDMSFGEHVDSIPISEEEAERFRETGDLPGKVRRWMNGGMYDDEA